MLKLDFQRISLNWRLNSLLPVPKGLLFRTSALQSKDSRLYGWLLSHLDRSCTRINETRIINKQYHYVATSNRLIRFTIGDLLLFRTLEEGRF